jgi:hypothetical protein
MYASNPYTDWDIDQLEEEIDYLRSRLDRPICIGRKNLEKMLEDCECILERKTSAPCEDEEQEWFYADDESYAM